MFFFALFGLPPFHFEVLLMGHLSKMPGPGMISFCCLIMKTRKEPFGKCTPRRSSNSVVFLVLTCRSFQRTCQDLHFLWQSCNQKLDSLCRFAYWAWHTCLGNFAMAFPRTRYCRAGWLGWNAFTEIYVLVVSDNQEL